MDEYQFVLNDENHLGVILGDDAPSFNELLKAVPLGKTIVAISAEDTPYIWELGLADKASVVDKAFNRKCIERDYELALYAYLQEAEKDDTGFNLWLVFAELGKAIRNWFRGLYG